MWLIISNQRYFVLFKLFLYADRVNFNADYWKLLGSCIKELDVAQVSVNQDNLVCIGFNFTIVLYVSVLSFIVAYVLSAVNWVCTLHSTP